MMIMANFFEDEILPNDMMDIDEATHKCKRNLSVRAVEKCSRSHPR